MAVYIKVDFNVNTERTGSGPSESWSQYCSQSGGEQQGTGLHIGLGFVWREEEDGMGPI